MVPKRWQAVIVSALCMASGMSAIFMGSFPVFLETVSRDLGWGRATFPQFITAVSVAAALLLPLAGRLIDRIGVRWPVAGGLLLVALGMVLLSTVRNSGAMFWLAGLCVGTGSALAGPPAFVGLISSWFDRSRALAIGFVVSVAPACTQAVVAPLTQELISDFGWRQAYRALALFPAAITLIVAAGLLRPCPSAPMMVPGGPLPASAGQALRMPTFWLLAVAGCLSSGTLLGLTSHIVAWQTGRGVTPNVAALLLSLLFMASMAGALLSGYVADRTRNTHILQLFYVLPLVGLALMGSSIALPAQAAGAILIGVAMGATTALAPYLATRYFGLKASAEIFGILLGLTMIALGAGPVLIGIGFDITGNYNLPIMGAALAVAIAAICVGLLDYAAGFEQRMGAPS